MAERSALSDLPASRLGQNKVEPIFGNDLIDVLVVGAGIVGLASAYHIKLNEPSARVLVIEKAQAPGQGDTAKSVGGVRNVFSSQMSRILGDTSVDFYHDQEKNGADLKLRFFGYLWLMSDKQFQTYESIKDDLHRDSVQVKVWSIDELKEMIPDFRLVLDHGDLEIQAMDLQDVAAGVQGIKCGKISVERLVRFYEEEFHKLGGEILYGLHVERLLVEPLKKLAIEGEPFEWQDKAITGVKIPGGEIRARKVVIATGTWGRELLEPVGVDSHMSPVRKMVFILRGPRVETLLSTQGFNEHGVLPMTLFPKSGLYLSPFPSEHSFYSAMTEGLGHPFALSENQPVDENYYVYNVNPVLSKYVPALSGLRPSSMYAGRQDWSSTDKNPYIFEVGNAVVATASSGNGISKGDAIGRIVAAVARGEGVAGLYGGKKFEVRKLGVAERIIERETFALH